MQNVIQVYNDDDVRKTARGRSARNAVGRALGRAYPTVPWLVDANVDGGVLNISCPAISRKWGMVLHLTRTNEDLARRAVLAAGELLERWNVSRTRSRFDHIPRMINGEARGAKGGELRSRAH